MAKRLACVPKGLRAELLRHRKPFFKHDNINAEKSSARPFGDARDIAAVRGRHAGSRRSNAPRSCRRERRTGGMDRKAWPPKYQSVGRTGKLLHQHRSPWAPRDGSRLPRLDAAPRRSKRREGACLCSPPRSTSVVRHPFGVGRLSHSGGRS